MERVTITVTDGVADVRLNRPDKMNALDPAMFAGLIAAQERLAADPSVRCVVLSGEGRAFCAGLDMASMAGMGGHGAGIGSSTGGHRLTDRTHGLANQPQAAAWGWRSLPQPVIGALHGAALGGGLQLALGCDLRIATTDTRLAVMELHWGIVPDMAGFVLSPGLIRDDVWRELVLTARQFPASEGQALGFVTHLDADPRARALSLAAVIAGRNPEGVRAAKRLLNAAAHPHAADILMQESVEQAALIGSPNQLEAVAANFAKRPPRFIDAA